MVAKRSRLIAYIFVASILLITAMLSSRHPPPKSVNFRFRFIDSTNSDRQSAAVIVSNILDSSVLCSFHNGFKEPVLYADYLSNGVWYSCSPIASHFDGGTGVLRGHQALTVVASFPTGADTVRVGLAVTPLSWRGRMGWSIESHWPGVFAPVGRVLLSSDTGVASHSRTEWSEPYKMKSGR